MNLYLLSDRYNNTMLVRAFSPKEAAAMFDMTEIHDEPIQEEQRGPLEHRMNDRFYEAHPLKVELVSVDGEPGVIRRIDTGYP